MFAAQVHLQAEPAPIIEHQLCSNISPDWKNVISVPFVTEQKEPKVSQRQSLWNPRPHNFRGCRDDCLWCIKLRAQACYDVCGFLDGAPAGFCQCATTSFWLTNIKRYFFMTLCDIKPVLVIEIQFLINFCPIFVLHLA